VVRSGWVWGIRWCGGLVGVGTAAGFEEIVVHSVGDDFVFPIAEFAFGVEVFEFQGGGFGGGLAVLF